MVRVEEGREGGGSGNPDRRSVRPSPSFQQHLASKKGPAALLVYNKLLSV